MDRWIVAVALSVVAASGAWAKPRPAAPLKPELAPVGFLLGRWSSDDGRVADTGQASRGTSSFTVQAEGAALLRRDHTELLDKSGAVAGGLDQVMLIYAEAGQLRADYIDGQHVIHYATAAVTPGKSVVFTSAPGAGPTFRLAYELSDAKVLSVSFSMAPPGSQTFRPVATGTMRRGPPHRRSGAAAPGPAPGAPPTAAAGASAAPAAEVGASKDAVGP